MIKNRLEFVISLLLLVSISATLLQHYFVSILLQAVVFTILPLAVIFNDLTQLQPKIFDLQLSGFIHDIKNLLNVLFIRLEMLYFQNATINDLEFSKLSQYRLRIDSMLESFLIIKKYQYNKGYRYIPDRKNLDIKTLSQEVISHFDYSIGHSSRTVEWLDCNSAKGFIELIDRRLFFRSLFNLIDNALKYSNSTVLVGCDPSKRVLFVADAGIGVINKELILKDGGFFDSSNTTGVGLGLTVVKLFCETHQCTLDLVDSFPGVNSQYNTIFTLTFAT